MPFFDQEPEPFEMAPTPEPRRRRWQGHPDDTLGVAVPLVALLARTDEIAIIASGIFAYPAGFAFTLIAFNRLDPPRLPMELMDGPSRFRQAAESGDLLQFGIGFSDGSKVTNESWRPSSRFRAASVTYTSALPTGKSERLSDRVLVRRGGSGGGRVTTQGYWCEPLPPPGPIQFVCEWNARGIVESTFEFEAEQLLEAAKRASPIWVDDVDLPEESGGPDTRYW
jgi:hypothetical protein